MKDKVESYTSVKKTIYIPIFVYMVLVVKNLKFCGVFDMKQCINDFAGVTTNVALPKIVQQKNL